MVQHIDFWINFYYFPFQAPICVVGNSTRVDVTELLEKRVKSRFSHRTILLLPNPSNEDRLQLFQTLLTIQNVDEGKKGSFIQKWNDNISNLAKNASVRKVLEQMLFCDTNQRMFSSFLVSINQLLINLISSSLSS